MKKSNTPEETITADSEFPRKPSTSSGRIIAYSVEVRLSDYVEPIQVGEQLITNKWKTVEYTNTLPSGVPIGNPYYADILNRFRLLSYPAAQAVRWWTHAIFNATTELPEIALQTRIIKHEVKYDYECKAVSEHGLVHGEDRSNMIPDWGVTP